MKLFGLKDENGKEYALNVKIENYDRYQATYAEPIEPTPKFKVGDWVIRKDEGVPMRIKCIDKYAFVCDDETSGHLLENAVGHCAFRLATESEIESHLIKVAESRGFKDGFKYRDQSNKGVFKLCLNKLTYWVDSDMLSDGYGGAIYEKGKWATIIPDKKPLPKTKKELMDLLVHIAVHNSHQHVRETLDEYED